MVNGKVVNFNPDLGRGYVEVGGVAGEEPTRLLFSVAQTQRGWGFPQGGDPVQVDVELEGGELVVKRVVPEHLVAAVSAEQAAKADPVDLFPLSKTWTDRFRPKGSAAKTVARIAQDTNWSLIFPPGAPCALGDILQINDDLAVTVGNVAHHGVTFGVVDGGAPQSSLTLTSRAGVTITPSGGAGDLAQVTISIEKGGGYVVAAGGIRFERVADVAQLASAMRSDTNIWNWDLSNRIVTEVAKVDNGFVMLTADAPSRVEVAVREASDADPLQQLAKGASQILSSEGDGLFVWHSIDVALLYRAEKLDIFRKLVKGANLT